MTDRDLLERRTESLARASVETVVRKKLLTLRVAGERYAIDPAAIRVVAELRRVTPLPHMPPRVLGLTAHAGTVIPVFDLRAVLGLPLTSLPEYGRIVVCGEPGDELALAVEGVEDDASVDDTDLLPMPATAGQALRAVARGMARGGVVVLDHQALLASELLFVDAPLPR